MQGTMTDGGSGKLVEEWLVVSGHHIQFAFI
jgi:hypothetical protein